jgi:sulfite exporter TauE/SafE
VPELSLAAAFLVGLLGGVHCVGMCGGIVAATGMHLPKRAGLPALLANNLGRLASYTAAGALAGLAGSASLFAGDILPVQKLLYAVAQLMLIFLGLHLAGLFSRVTLAIEAAGGALWKRLGPKLARMLPPRSLAGWFAAGALWGWLPCGLVYSVLIAALAQASAAHGALLMAAFGLGTLPNLLAMGFAARRLQAWLSRPWVRRGAGLTVAAMGVWGLAKLAGSPAL